MLHTQHILQSTASKARTAQDSSPRTYLEWQGLASMDLVTCRSARLHRADFTGLCPAISLESAISFESAISLESATPANNPDPKGAPPN